MKKRCSWCTEDPIYVDYHDNEWGIPVHDDIHLFEMLTLEGAQAGLSWLTILRKRENYRKAFDGFRPETISKYDSKKIETLLNDPGIIRNRLKIEAAIHNARHVLKIQEEFGSLDSYLWRFVGERPIQNTWRSLKEIPCQSKESDLMSRELKKSNFKFVGTKICYAFMQAVGMVNDHEVSCFCYARLVKLSE
ncbi:MAG TPA: DNA-3-methyladenine glycosylase I [Thermodesulfobacteriota bacterium]|nr:DNA-3-methyladenine glycosylase I [Thermodesulfobacteriota bacterium]